MSTGTNRFSFLDILDRTFRIYRENFSAIIGYVALIALPVTIINLLLSRSVMSGFTTFQTRSSSVNSGALLSSLLVAFLSLIEIVLTYSAVSYIASESYFGRKASIGEAFAATRSSLGKLGCGFILFYIILVGFAFVIVFIASVCAPALIGLVLVAYIGIATFGLLTPVLVLENVGTSTGINRAYGLGRARFWTLVIVLVAIYIISFILDVALASVIQLLGIPVTNDPFSGGQLLSTFASAIIGILVTPLFPIAMTLMYYETRTQVEGLDLALATLDKPDARPSDLESPRAPSFLNSRDLINMLLLGVGGVALSLVAGGLLLSIVNSLAPGLTLSR